MPGPKVVVTMEIGQWTEVVLRRGKLDVLGEASLALVDVTREPFRGQAQRGNGFC